MVCVRAAGGATVVLSVVVTVLPLGSSLSTTAQPPKLSRTPAIRQIMDFLLIGLPFVRAIQFGIANRSRSGRSEPRVCTFCGLPART